MSPILPLFLPELGVSTEAGLYLWCGALGSVTSFVAALMSPFWGRVADRRGRKQMVLRSCVAIGACTILMGLVQDVWQMLATRLLMGVFAGFSAASMILVSTLVPMRNLSYALGLMGSGQLAGSLVGPVLGGVLADLTQSYRLPFFGAGALALLSGVVCLVMVRESFAPPKDGGARMSVLASLARIRATPGLVALVAVLLLSQFATQAVQPIVALYVQEIVGQRANLATLGGIALSVTGIAGIVAVPLLGRASDRFGGKRVLVFAMAGAALATAPQSLVGSYGGFVPIANALIARTVKESERGVTLGVTSSAYFLGNSLGPACGGVVAAYAGLPWVFVLTTCLLLAGLCWVAAAVPGRGGGPGAVRS
jgi:DHA1 family multidrug resistance protein-like MFS transporter